MDKELPVDEAPLLWTRDEGSGCCCCGGGDGGGLRLRMAAESVAIGANSDSIDCLVPCLNVALGPNDCAIIAGAAAGTIGSASANAGVIKLSAMVLVLCFVLQASVTVVCFRLL